jgi:hypothetical protein
MEWIVTFSFCTRAEGVGYSRLTLAGSFRVEWDFGERVEGEGVGGCVGRTFSGGWGLI